MGPSNCRIKNIIGIVDKKNYINFNYMTKRKICCGEIIAKQCYVTPIKIKIKLKLYI